MATFKKLKVMYNSLLHSDMLRRFVIFNPNPGSNRQFGSLYFLFALWLMCVGYCGFI